MLCMDGETIMDIRSLETYVEKYINGDALLMPQLPNDATAMETFYHNTASVW